MQLPLHLQEEQIQEEEGTKTNINIPTFSPDNGDLQCQCYSA